MATFKKNMALSVSIAALLGIASIAKIQAHENLLKSLDKDLDGLISLKEAAANAYLLENFNSIDVNEDGYVSMDELTTSDISKATKASYKTSF